MFSRYSHCIVITTNELVYPFTDTKLWMTMIPALFKRLNCVLELYGMQYSEPVFMYEHDWNDRLLNYDDCDKYNIYNYYGYKVISEYDSEYDFEESIQYDEDELKIIMFFDMPEFTSLRKAYRFICNIIRNVWKSKYEQDIYWSIFIYKSQEKKFYKNDIYDCITVFRREINDIIDINNLKRIPLLNMLKYMAPTVGRIVFDMPFDELTDILKGNKKQHH